MKKNNSLDKLLYYYCHMTSKALTEFNFLMS